MNESGSSKIQDWFDFCDEIRATEIRTQYFQEPENDLGLWITTTTLYFNYLGLNPEQAKAFLVNLLTKAQEGKKRDGVNGSSWQHSLSPEEETLVDLLHLKNHYTNYGIELYVTTCQKNLIQ
jgi:hypothetical protein